jgi:hypothetical protein
MKEEFYKLAEQYAECWSVGNGGKVEYVFSETGLLLFGLEIFEQMLRKIISCKIVFSHNAIF